MNLTHRLIPFQCCFSFQKALCHVLAQYQRNLKAVFSGFGDWWKTTKCHRYTPEHDEGYERIFLPLPFKTWRPKGITVH